MHRNKRFTIILLAFLLASCSVKEDREECPCLLQLDLHPCLAVSDDVVVAVWNESGAEQYFRDTVHVSDCPDVYERNVRRGQAIVCVHTGTVAGLEEGNGLTIPYGHDSDMIYAVADRVACSGESCRDTVVLHKQFATLLLKLERTENGKHSYSFNVESDIAGMDLLTLLPIGGKFRHDVVFDEEDVGRVNLPRHPVNNENIVLNILEGGFAVAMVNLSEMIREADYDWTSESLEDIYVRVDYAEASVKVSIYEWSEGQKQEIIL